MPEIERKYLVADPPPLPGAGTPIRQGYLAIDGDVEVRVRAKGPARVLTVKGGRGRVRAEVETAIEAGEFDELWPLTEGRRIAKRRHEVTHADRTIEVDVFEDALAGLVVAEVEFPDDEAAARFEPPPWFGPEVTDDERWSNARLAIDGRPPAP